MRQRIGTWVPAVFCAFISYTALYSSSDNYWRPVFFSFLPMCFVFAGISLWQLQREVRGLRERLAQLEQKD
jgi:hypothetical protein